MIRRFSIIFLTLVNLALVLTGCASGQNVKTPDPVVQKSIPAVEQSAPAEVVLKDSLVAVNAEKNENSVPAEPAPEEIFPEDTVKILASWQSFCYALQAMEDLEWKVAKRYLDKASHQLVAEKNSGSGTDSLYMAEMPLMIASAMEEVKPNLANANKDESRLDDEDETPADSATMEKMEMFLDTLDVSQFSLPIEFNERVVQEIYYLTGAAKGFISGSLNRKTAFDSLIYAKLEEAKMPKDLIYLSLVESGFKVRAYSPAQASGLWQFIPETGRRYGVDVDLWLDQRRNPEMATEAALKYLKDLYGYFGDWQLAMAAYNCGEGRVRRLIKELKADTTRDTSKAITYWDLPLPTETMHYVPRILAAMVIGHYPEQYDIAVKPQPSVPYDTVTVYDSFSLDDIAKVLKVKPDVMSNLNAELIKGFTPPNRESYVLRVPVGKRDMLVKNYDKLEKNDFSGWVHHKVKRGENLGKIAKSYGIKVSDVQMANAMRDMKVRVGQTLLIPIRVAKEVKETKNIDAKKVGKGKTYTVKLGDNLSTIARKFNVAQENIRIWNNMDVSSMVTVGDVIFVSKPELKPDAGDKKKLPSLLKNRKYVILSGDTYASIAEAFDMPVGLLLLANKGYTRRLSVGDTIYVPKYVKKLPQAPAQPVVIPEGAPAKTDRQLAGKVEPVSKDDKKAPKVKANEKLSVYTVESGDNLGYISMLFGMTVARIQELNKMGSSTNIYVGQKLYVIGDKQDVPVKSDKKKDDKKTSEKDKKDSKSDKDKKKDDKKASEKDKKDSKSANDKKTDNKNDKKSDSKSAGSFRQHTVKKGESLWDISRQYKVSIEDIVKWNGLSDTKIKEGVTLKIKK
ncbi:MAG: LysM peptidoglycan-binding domain-containing protein [Fibrobacter sp.]|nr:LysM peptidoglycan-binding domain-containing protein [Fibrobacter sp.]